MEDAVIHEDMEIVGDKYNSAVFEDSSVEFLLDEEAGEENAMACEGIGYLAIKVGVFVWGLVIGDHRWPCDIKVSDN